MTIQTQKYFTVGMTDIRDQTNTIIRTCLIQTCFCGFTLGQPSSPGSLQPRLVFVLRTHCMLSFQVWICFRCVDHWNISELERRLCQYDLPIPSVSPTVGMIGVCDCPGASERQMPDFYYREPRWCLFWFLLREKVIKWTYGKNWHWFCWKWLVLAYLNQASLSPTAVLEVFSRAWHTWHMSTVECASVASHCIFV